MANEVGSGTTRPSTTEQLGGILTGKTPTRAPSTTVGGVLPGPKSRRLTPAELDKMVKQAGAKYGIDPAWIKAIVMTEAPSLQTDIRGDGGKSVGLAQIYGPANPGITAAQAADPNFAINYIAKRMSDFKKRYPNAPREAILLQHNNPSAATKLAKGQITVEQANKASGTGRYVTDVLGKLGVQAPAPGRGGAAAGGAVTGTPGSVKSILDLGMTFLGVPYKWGGTDPSGFDCSGLLQYIYGKNGIQLPRVSSQQATAGVGVTADQAQAGDLIAFDNDPGRPGIDHIGVYLGNGRMLQAPRTGRNIEVVNVDLGRAKAIRRVTPASAYGGLTRTGNKFVYTAASTPGGTAPESITVGTGGGDVGNDPTRFLGADGKVDPAKAISEYGYIAELAKSVPDINKVLTQAISEGWTADRFAAEIQKTNWWRTTSNTQRQVEELKKTNPGEYRRQRQLMIDNMVTIARNLGVEEGNQRIFILAERALSQGWTQQEIERYLAADVKVADPNDPKAKANTGQAAITVDSLKEQAAQYGVPLSQKTLQTWTTQVLRGMVPMESFQSYLKEQAKLLFPGLAKAIDSGVTVEQYVEPYKQIAAQTLELNPEDIRLGDKFMQKALYQQSKDGTRTSMSLSDFQTFLRGTQEYRGTRQAQETAAGFVNTVTEMFGKTA